jgi:hypothetical protein
MVAAHIGACRLPGGGGPDGAVRVEHDRHVEGLFSRALWLRLLSEAGFQAHVVPFEHSELEPGSHEVFVAKRPGA